MKNTMPYLLLGIFRRDKLRNFRTLLHSQWMDTAEIRKIQEKKFLNLIGHCVKNVPYYSSIKGFSEVRTLDDIKRLPFLTKGIIREHQSDIKAKNIDRKFFVPNSTSGSTGEGLRFYSDLNNSMDFGVLMRNNMWTGWELGKRQTFLWGSHYDISRTKELFNRIKNMAIYKTLFLSSYEMTENDMRVYRDKINDYKPLLFTGYPSALFIFASFLEREGLDICKVKGVITSGETLYEYQREKIEAIFGCKVFNRYGCRELGDIAHQCEEHDGMHINTEHVIVEVVDKDGNPCEPGKEGEIVVTNLDNYAFPFIRYKIQDIGVLKKGVCRCRRGLPLLEKVEGRIFDIIVGTNGNHLSGNYWTILLRTFIKGIEKFQIIQEKKGELDLCLVVNKGFNDTEKERLVREVMQRCGRDMRIKIAIAEDIPLTESGKHRFIISKVSPFAA